METVEKISVSHKGSRDIGAFPPFLRTKWGLFPITIFLFSTVFLISSTIRLERTFAEEIYASVSGSMSFTGPLDIFAHNLALSIMMMIPVVGFGFSIISSSTTGLAVSAISTINNLDSLSVAARLLSTPAGMLEFLAYGLASAQGLAGLFAIIEKRVNRELKEYLTTLIIVSGLLLAAALVETMSLTEWLE